MHPPAQERLSTAACASEGACGGGEVAPPHKLHA